MTTFFHSLELLQCCYSPVKTGIFRTDDSTTTETDPVHLHMASAVHNQTQLILYPAQGFMHMLSSETTVLYA